MAIEYFGYTATAGISWDSVSTKVFRNMDYNFTCPGSGAVPLVSLAAYLKGNGLNGYVRVAIASSSSLLAQGSAKLSVTAAAGEAWFEHTTFTDDGGTPVTPNLTGGNNYFILTTFTEAQQAYIDGTPSKDFIFRNTELTDGFPDPIDLVAGASTPYRYVMRAGVETGAGSPYVLVRP